MLWPAGTGRKWTDEDEHREQRGMLSRIVRGLAARCEQRIFVASSQLSISGQENDGPLAPEKVYTLDHYLLKQFPEERVARLLEYANRAKGN